MERHPSQDEASKAGSTSPTPRRAGRPGNPGILAEARHELGVTHETSPLPMDASALDHFQRGSRLAGTDPRGAGAEFIECLAQDGSMAAAWNNLGVILVRMQAWGLPRRCFEEARAADPNNALAIFNLAQWQERRGHFKEADARYLEALEKSPALWSPSLNPAIIGNEHAARALHARYLARDVAGPLVLDPGPLANAPAATPEDLARTLAKAPSAGRAGTTP